MKACCYSSIDDIIIAIVKRYEKNKESNCSPITQESTGAASSSKNISWKVDEATQELQLMFFWECGTARFGHASIFIRLENYSGHDHKHCQNFEHRQES